MADWGPPCKSCGHPASYHGATFCQVRAGAETKKPCDCSGYDANDDDIAALTEELTQVRAENERLKEQPLYKALTEASLVERLIATDTDSHEVNKLVLEAADELSALSSLLTTYKTALERIVATEDESLVNWTPYQRHPTPTYEIARVALEVPAQPEEEK